MGDLVGVPPSDEAALLGGVVAAILGCATRPLWPLARLVVTAVHELGHALAALALGGRVHRIHLWHDTAGLTTYAFPFGTGRARNGAVALAGYPAPGLAGVLGAALFVTGGARWWVALSALVALVLLALWVRNPWGVLSTALTALGLGWVAIAGPSWSVTAVGGALAVLLLAGGWRAAAAHASGRERGRRAGASDAVAAAQLLPLPAALWSGLFFASATATLIAGAWLLLTAWR